MRTVVWLCSFALSVGSLVTGCATSSAGAHKATGVDGLVGAWRSKVQFKSGDWAKVRDLEFLYVFNPGGTMTESSNYDGAPPVPPAYGVWRKTGLRQYEAKYVFFITKPPATFEDISKGGGWQPAGYGVFVERITVSEDGKASNSTIKYDAYDQAGKPTETGNEADVEGSRLSF